MGGAEEDQRGTMIDGAAGLAILATGVALIAGFGLLRGRRLDQRRSVLVHVPARQVWESVRDLPALHGGFGKAREFGAARDFILHAGDGETSGSIWRVQGQWGGALYWAEVEIVRFKPQEVIGFRLLRDSLGTHRRLQDHLGALSLEAIDPRTTKVSWRLRARLRGPRLLVSRLLFRDRLAARLLDQGLRSIKLTLESSVRRPRAAAGDGPQEAPHAPAESARPIPVHGEQQAGPGGGKTPPREPRPEGPVEPTL